ncbi:MAG: DUF4101 domain-containing protein, partial [Kamptonema sp. SIO4C4]|nr:DUF4101 domain-containing protein [Kamptonema sp. SIO4C4]
LQLPRREYSDNTINARKQLLDEAYAVLCDPELRSTYDASFLAKTYELESEATERSSNLGTGHPATTPWLEISHEQFVGALLILHELGEYDLVLQLGRPLLEPRQSLTPEQQQIVSVPLVRTDIVLTLAIACLEAGRDQWQQGQSEKAATYGQIGQDLLLQEGLFPNLRGEIQADLYKLRPYRVLELLSQEQAQDTQRQKGIQLLQEMFHERGGIDGNGDDQSGLGIDDFLKFIQQIRSYLTASEQQEIFEQEARRPSAVGTYLAIYAMVARGFTERQPGLIARAKEWLTRLSRRQDVHLEQAVCALLLGQTEEASRALELSQEYEPLAFIREHSQGSPDLLPGLCLYGERWLQTEVFPHFRDLSSQQASLKDYFADERVQAYLEQIPGEEEAENQWSVVESQPEATQTQLQENAPAALTGTETGRSRETAPQGSRAQRSTAVSQRALTAAGQSARERSGTAAPERPTREGRPATSATRQTPPGGSSRTQRDRGENAAPESPQTPFTSRRSARRYTPDSTFGRYLLIGLGGIAALILIGFSLSQVSQWFAGDSETNVSEQPTEASPESPTATEASPEATPEPTPDTLDENLATKVVSSWLAAKAAALGENHQIDALNSVLTEPLLTEWQNIARQVEQDNAYREYSHTVSVESVQINPNNPNLATVQATVQEMATAYRNGQPDAENSYDSTLSVRYSLVKEEETWKIQEVQVF